LTSAREKAGGWYALDVDLDRAAYEAVEYALMEAGALGTETTDRGVTAYFAETPNREQVRNELFEALRIYELPSSSVRDMSLREVAERDWLEEWKQGWQPVEIGRFIIAPPCAGVNFALAAFLALALGGLGGITTAKRAALRLAAAAAIAYVATLIVNTTRIAIAVAMHRGTIDVGDWDRSELHRIEGIVVYLGGLCALYALARSVEMRRSPTKGGPSGQGSLALRTRAINCPRAHA